MIQHARMVSMYIEVVGFGDGIPEWPTYPAILRKQEPLEDVEVDKHVPRMPIYDKIQQLSLSEVKELLGEVDVKKKAKNHLDEQHNNEDIAHPELYDAYNSYLKGYNQALECNKDKKWTDADVIHIVAKSRQTGLTAEYLMISLQSQTEWEVEFADGKLKLKS